MRDARFTKVCTLIATRDLSCDIVILRESFVQKKRSDRQHSSGALPGVGGLCLDAIMCYHRQVVGNAQTSQRLQHECS